MLSLIVAIPRQTQTSVLIAAARSLVILITEIISAPGAMCYCLGFILFPENIFKVNNSHGRPPIWQRPPFYEDPLKIYSVSFFMVILNSIKQSMLAQVQTAGR